MSTLHFRLDDLPEQLRLQALAKLGDSSVLAATLTPSSAFAIPPPASAPAARPARDSAASPPDPWQGSSKTEQRFYTWHIAPLGLSFSQVYETLRLKLAPGTFYTPDFVFQDGGRLVAVEVKGSYRLGSAGRAYTAFMTARDRFPWLAFEWWEARGGGFVRKH
jgi:hypothetical protein